MANVIDVHDQDELPGYFLGIDFRNVIPSVAQKQWMVDRIRSGVEKAAGIARRYHIKRKLLNVLAKRSRQGIPIRVAAGRPRVLDTLSHEAIASNIIDLTCTSIDDLRVEIKSEYKSTFERRHPVMFAELAGQEDAVKIARRTLKRYISRLHPGVFPDVVGAQNLELQLLPPLL